jgi:catechol 2,3-dioxygenase-like lactoylglutathione lyase family enzyme
MNITGFNHVTMVVSNLEVSLHFYEEVLGLKKVHQGDTDAYLEWGDAWICLMERKVESGEKHRATGVDHVAFSIAASDFDDAIDHLMQHEVSIVRGPLARGGGHVVNFLDPDGIQLELNTSDLKTRMKDWR